MKSLHGNLGGLKPSETRSLQYLYRRRLAPDQIVSPELARNLTELSEQIGRQVGVFVDRRGAVTHVIVGDANRITIPELGRARAGARRFRGLRLLHTHLLGEKLSRDDLTDLSLLRLDLVAAIQVGEKGLPGTLEYATLLPPDQADNTRDPWRIEGPIRVHDIVENFGLFIDALEGEFTTARAAAEGTTDDRTRAILVGVQEASDGLSGVDRRMDELERLASTAGLHVIDRIVQKRTRVDPKTLIGKGKLEDLLVRSMYLEADLLVFDRDLNPSQGRKISEATELKVIDRTQLILDIFAQHALSQDGRLQVELAQLKYLLPRLRAMQQGLSRLTGGIGGRGPGETKLEIRDRRARDRITLLKKKLKVQTKRRELRRGQRNRSGVPVAAIVGYTNAGKSTLLNALTRSKVIAEDKLFATLDTTSRRMRFPDAREVVITDTVGFIEHLPKDLMQAFEATLEELHDADLLVHVIDASDPYIDLHRGVVEQVVMDLGLGELPVLRVLNKIDLLSPEEAEVVCREHEGVGVSALSRDGLEDLMHCLEEAMWRRGRGDLRPDFVRVREGA
ncbi:MAG: GTPase HflX [Proteobacteria bacterium]|nr:GTPase HflX [Pseudomonadota bacterium]